MRLFALGNQCPTCGFGSLEDINRVTACKAKATEVPLRCEYCADPEEVKNFSGSLFYSGDGKVYRPIPKMVEIEYMYEVQSAMPDPNDSTKTIPAITEMRRRNEKVVDLEATLAQGPLQVPKTILHVHRHCLRCGDEWPEQLQE